MAALRKVDNPEVGESRVDLGVVEGVKNTGYAVPVTRIPIRASALTASVQRRTWTGTHFGCLRVGCFWPAQPFMLTFARYVLAYVVFGAW